MAYGASPEAWDHFADKLGLVDDLLPVVSNPNAEISEQSKMAALGKTPSVYNRAGKVAGLPKWTGVMATPHNVQMWKSQPDYGICLQTRHVRAFDIDVRQAAKANAIREAIEREIGRKLPVRFRADSGKILLAFTYNRPLTKHVLQVDGGIVELLADGQQFIAAGTHPDGEPYLWEGGLPAAFPVLSHEELERVLAALETLFDTGDGWKIARERRKGSGDDLPVHDDVADWLLENWETYDVGSDDQLFIACPFADQHTSDTGPSSTAYFPAGTGGYSQGHFVCLHAHCAGRTDADFRDGTGYSLGQFENLDADGAADAVAGGQSTAVARSAVADPVVAEAREARPWPNMVRDGGGKIEPTAFNMQRAIADGGMIFRHVAYDTFTDNLMWCELDEDRETAQWQRFTDNDMVKVRMELEQRGFKPMSKDLFRECVHSAGRDNQLDTAQTWLTRLRWDGVERVASFAADCWGWKDSEYSTAVSRYVWTALAGRVLQPGVRADMAPILVGAQGKKKTTVIQMMAPSEDFYAEIKLDDRDDDISRKLRGKLVGELEELRGLNSRAIEEIKAFVSRRRESWVPKFKEFENFFWRRCIFFGTTNDTQFLADPTGERRWLPGECGLMDVERILETRDQLWAEGAVLFAMDGVAWADAERLAEREHPRFKIGDSWEQRLASWLDEEQLGGAKVLDKGYVTTGEALSAIGIQLSQANRGHEMRVQKALRHIGLREIDVSDGSRSFKGYERV